MKRSLDTNIHNAEFSSSFEMASTVIKEDTPNSLHGIANVMGVVDSYRSVFYPGAYKKKVMDDFVESGFITYNHVVREEFPVGMPTKMSTQGYALLLSMDFHEKSTKSQELRDICMERMSKNKKVGLSVGGYGEEVYFKNGKNLLAHAEGLGCNMDLFDAKTIEKYTDGIWGIPEVNRLKEVAITFCPAVPGSDVIAVRSEDVIEFDLNSTIELLKANWSDEMEKEIQKLMECKNTVDTNFDEMEMRMRMFKLRTVGVN